MPPTTTVVRDGDVTAEQLTADQLATVAKGQPGFAPSPDPARYRLPARPAGPAIAGAAAAPAVEIPDGPPDVAALAWLRQLDASAALSIQVRLNALSRQLGDLVEKARLGGFDGAGGLSSFILAAGRGCRVRRELESRLGAIGGPPGPGRPAAAVEVLAMVRSVRRWADGAEIRAEWVRRAATVQRELASIGSDLAVEAARVNGAYRSDPNTMAHQEGFADHQDVWLQRAADLIARYQSARARAASLGDDLAARAAAVKAAVKATGPDRIAEAIAPAMQVEDRAPGLRASADAARKRLASIDPETNLHAELSGEAARLEEAAAKAAAEASAERLARAAAIVQRATTGELGPVSALARLAAGRLPDLAAALATALAGDVQLTATIDEVLSEHKAKLRADIELRQAMLQRSRGAAAKRV